MKGSYRYWKSAGLSSLDCVTHSAADVVTTSFGKWMTLAHRMRCLHLPPWEICDAQNTSTWYETYVISCIDCCGKWKVMNEKIVINMFILSVL